jgi:hypothetical protein
MRMFTFKGVVACLQQSERERDVDACHLESRHLHRGIDGGHRRLANGFLALNYSVKFMRGFLPLLASTSSENVLLHITHTSKDRNEFVTWSQLGRRKLSIAVKVSSFVCCSPALTHRAKFLFFLGFDEPRDFQVVLSVFASIR